MDLGRFSDLDFVKFISLRTGEAILDVRRDGETLSISGSFADSQGVVLRLHEGGTEDHLADAHIELSRGGNVKRILVKGHAS